MGETIILFLKVISRILRGSNNIPVITLLSFSGLTLPTFRKNSHY
jgi:hypothetical protein